MQTNHDSTMLVVTIFAKDSVADEASEDDASYYVVAHHFLTRAGSSYCRVSVLCLCLAERQDSPCSNRPKIPVLSIFDCSTPCASVNAHLHARRCFEYISYATRACLVPFTCTTDLIFPHFWSSGRAYNF